MKSNRKLSIKKETISHLSNQELSRINGGDQGRSTNHRLTCGLCTKIDTKDVIKVTTIIIMQTKK